MDNYNLLIEKLNSISLDGFSAILPNIIEQINNKDINFYEALNIMVDNQIKVKKDKVYAAGIKVSHFPFIKTLNDWLLRDVSAHDTLFESHRYARIEPPVHRNRAT